MTSEQRTISFKEMVIQSTMSSATTTTTTTTITMTTVTTSSSLDHRINNREESGKKIFSNKEFGSKALTSDFDDNYSQRRSIRKDSIEIPPIPDNPQPPPSNHFLNHLHRYRNNDDDDDQDDDYNDDGDDNSDDEDDNGGNDGDLDENIAPNDYDGSKEKCTTTTVQMFRRHEPPKSLQLDKNIIIDDHHHPHHRHHRHFQRKIKPNHLKDANYYKNNRDGSKDFAGNNDSIRGGCDDNDNTNNSIDNNYDEDDNHNDGNQVNVVGRSDSKRNVQNINRQQKRQQSNRTEDEDLCVFDFDIKFDGDESEELIDFSIYENRTGLAEDMKFLASMPELCDITFLVGETREPVCAVKAVLASRSRVFHKLLYGQKQQPSYNPMNHHGRGHHHHHHHDGKSDKSTKRKESTRDTKLKLFLKRSSEPILNGLPFNQQQPSVQTHQTMIIEEFEPDVFRQLIEYIHTGCVILQARTLLGLMNAADYYGLEELRRACIGFVTCCITVDTVNSILASAERYIQYKCTKSLVQRVLEFVDKHGNEVLSLGSFALLPEHVVRLILSREELKADELTKFQAALHWSQRSCDASCGTLDLRDVIANFLECIEFYKIPASILMREVHPLGVVPDYVIMNALAFQADPSSVDIRKVESPNRFRRMTLPHAFNVAESDLIHLKHTANFWAERAEAAAAAASNQFKDNGKDKKEKSSRIGLRRASKPFKRSKTLMESS